MNHKASFGIIYRIKLRYIIPSALRGLFRRYQFRYASLPELEFHE